MKAHNYIKQFETKVKELIDNNTIIRDCNTPFTSMDISSKQKINKKTMGLNNTWDQICLMDIFRTFHPKTAEYTFFSYTYRPFSRIDHILGHKTGLNKHKNIEIIPCIFLDHNTMKLEVNHKKKSRKTTNTWRLNNMLVNNEWVNQETKEEILKIHGNK